VFIKEFVKKNNKTYYILEKQVKTNHERIFSLNFLNIYQLKNITSFYFTCENYKVKWAACDICLLKNKTKPLKLAFFFIIIINVGIRASLRVSQLILQALKLTTM
jgi:hypothetical protein